MAVKSALRVLQILEHLLDYPNGLTAKEVSEQLEIAPSSTHALLKTLSEQDYLIEDVYKRYTLGPKLIQLGHNAESYLDINKLAVPYLNTLMARVEETVFMAILSQEEIVYVAKINNNNTMSTNANIGSRKPIYCTGLGKVFLSFMKQEESDEIISNLSFESYTPNTVKDEAELRKQMEVFKEQGYAIDDEEIEEGLYCVAVPIFGADDSVTMAVSVSGLKPRMLSKREQIIKELSYLSVVLSKKLGYAKGIRK